MISFLKQYWMPCVLGIALGSAGIDWNMWQFWVILLVYSFKEEFLK